MVTFIMAVVAFFSVLFLVYILTFMAYLELDRWLFTKDDDDIEAYYRYSRYSLIIDATALITIIVLSLLLLVSLL